jgi:peptidoglycan/xylan/chitin deacetylase (PgdA/CDA1 family)
MKILILYLIKFLGGFWLSRKIISDKTLILAYHGFEVFDESDFRPNLFIKPSTLNQRLKYLQNHCHVIPLADFEKVSKPKNAVIITVDDGWASTLTHASSIFDQYDFPYTIYLTTENVLDNQPVFHILLNYILHSSIGKILSISREGKNGINATISETNITDLIKEIDQLKSTRLDTSLLKDIAKNLEMDIQDIIAKKAFTLMSTDEVKKITDLGADIQLHTHSHCTFLDDEEAFNNEIRLNQQHISEILGNKALHHCYPSGRFNTNSIQWLKRLGIMTATTCTPGFCDENSNRLALPRFLDGENISQIIFEAEVSGVLELLRKIKYKFSAN